MFIRLPPGILLSKNNKSPLKWRHYEPSLILLCVRWYCRHQPSYRDLEEMMRERGLAVDHTTVFRRVRRYAPEINRMMRPHLKMSGASFHTAERTLEGVESMHVLRKGQVKRLDGRETRSGRRSSS